MGFDPLAPIRLGFRIGIGVLRFELRIIEQLLGDGDVPAAAPTRAAPASYRPEPRDPVPEPAPAPPRPAAEPTSPPPAPAPAPEPEPSPGHIDDEPELVAEFADPGAEEGAGAEIRVDEPWEGYRKMTAAAVRDRAAVADAAELAVIQLYESTHRRRRTVLEAAERRSKELANAPAQRAEGGGSASAFATRDT